MPSRGPRPTPTALLKARGSWRAKARTNEPMAERTTPEMPSMIMDEVAIAMWDRIIPVLDDMGVITIADGNAIARYCTIYAKWFRSEMFLKSKTNLTYPVRDGNGNIRGFKPWPEVKLSLEYASALLRLEQEFGLTPSARTSIDTVIQAEVANGRLKESGEDKSRFFA